MLLNRSLARAGSPAPRIAVVGAGIIGASIAWRLASAGARVTVLEKGRPGAGATQGAFAMLISTHDGDDREFNALYGMAVRDWRRTQRELGSALQVQWGGQITWASAGPAADQIAAAARQLQGWGSPVRLIDLAEFSQLAPGVRPGPVGAASFTASTGAVDSLEALAAFERAARSLGVEFRYPCEVRSFVVDGGRIRRLGTTSGALEVDQVVLAAGAATPELARQLGVKTPIDVVSGTLAHSRPHARALDRVLVGPDGSLKQDPDGRIVIGPDYRPGAHGVDTSEAYGEKLLAAAARIVPGLRGAKLETMTLGYVPIPIDSHPIVGFCASPSNLYVALTMSGITMAPLISRFAASEIIHRAPVAELGRYRPARFA